MSGHDKSGGVLTSIVITKQSFNQTHHQVTDNNCLNKFLHGIYSFHKDKTFISFHQMGGEKRLTVL
jgi:hypothetical protein